MAGKDKKNENDFIVAAENRQARRDYEIIDVIEAGIVLLGSEVKSIRAGGANLKESYIRPKNGEMFLVGCHISPYKHSHVEAHEPTREKKLLLHKLEIERLAASVQQKGLTLVPIQLHFKKGRCKLQFGLGKGKKHHDKREDVKKREAEREMERALRARNKS